MRARPRNLAWQLGALLCGALAICSCRALIPPEAGMNQSPSLREAGPAGLPSMQTIIPKPVAVTPTAATFSLTAGTRIAVEPGSDELLAIGNYLAQRLRPATGYALPVQAATGAPPARQIYLTTAGGDPALGEEGYKLDITP